MKWSRLGLKRRVQNIVLGSPMQKDAVSVPTDGWRRVFLVVRQFYLRIIGLNLLFILCCIPVFTIPAAIYAMTAVSSKWVRDLPCETIRDFFSAFKAAFIKTWLLGFALLLMPLSLSFYPMLGGITTLSLAVFVLSATFDFLLCAYWYPLSVSVALSPLTNLKNALILMVCEWRITLQILGTVGVAYVLLALMPEYVLPFFLIVLFALGQVVICSLTNATIVRHCVTAMDHSGG